MPQRFSGDSRRRAHADGDFDSEGDQSQYEEFYTPPDPLPPGQPGDVIRTEQSRLVLEPSGQLGAIFATGTRIMYRSTDARGKPIAVTGKYFEPDNPWPGSGPRPLLGYAPGTQGQGDQCAPSRMFSQGIHWSPWLDFTVNYEETFVATMVARGFAIVMTDYEGLGTPGVHTYVNRLAEGQAVLDAARAAQRLPGTSLDPHGPVALVHTLATIRSAPATVLGHHLDGVADVDVVEVPCGVVRAQVDASVTDVRVAL